MKKLLIIMVLLGIVIMQTPLEAAGSSGAEKSFENDLFIISSVVSALVAGVWMATGKSASAAGLVMVFSSYCCTFPSIRLMDKQKSVKEKLIPGALLAINLVFMYFCVKTMVNSAA
jgi:hypothetical protein